MFSEKLFTTKTFYAALATIATGGYLLVTGLLLGLTLIAVGALALCALDDSL